MTLELLRRTTCFTLLALLFVAPRMQAQAPSGSLWYNGDFDGVNGYGNARNTDPTRTSGSAIYDDFIVPASDGSWLINAVFSDNLADTTIMGADWSIRTGVSLGNAGTVLYSGTGDLATVSATGRFGFTYTEYRVTVSGLNIQLAPGTYWLQVTPVGNGRGDSFITTTSGAQAVGMPAGNDGDAYSVNPNGGYFVGTDNHDFSMGVVGIKVVPEPTPLALLVGAFGVLGAVAVKRRFK